MPDDLREVVDRKLSALVSGGSVRSVGYAVVCAGSDVVEVTGGGLGGADERTVFQIGSVTKVFTGLLLADLAVRGVVRLGDAAAGYLGGDVSAGTVSLLDLATHTSGLPRLPPGMIYRGVLRPRDPYRGYPVARLLRAARRGLAATGGPRPYAYSNFGYAVLGQLLGRAAGAGYETLVGERICGPLGMGDTSFQAEDRVIQGCSRGRPVPVWHLGAFTAAGGLYSTAADLARLVVACLRPEETPLPDALHSSLEPRRSAGPGAEIGLAWHFRAGPVIMHNGMTGGFSSIVALLPSRHVGVAALANAGGVGTPPLDRAVLSALT